VRDGGLESLHLIKALLWGQRRSLCNLGKKASLESMPLEAKFKILRLGKKEREATDGRQLGD